MITDYPEMPVDESSLNQKVITEYRKHMDLLSVLNEHILFADRENTRSLLQLSEVSRRIQAYPPTLVLYRGIGSWSAQESLGLDIKSVKTGDRFVYSSSDKLVPFTTNESIARAFGPVVVSCSVDTRKSKLLILTDEMMFLISKMRNHTSVKTQKEVIILPPFNLVGKVVSVRKKSLFEIW